MAWKALLAAADGCLGGPVCASACGQLYHGLPHRAIMLRQEVRLPAHHVSLPGCHHAWHCRQQQSSSIQLFQEEEPSKARTPNVS